MYIHTSIELSFVNCLVSHAENISGLSVQLLKTLQQVVLSFPSLTPLHYVIVTDKHGTQTNNAFLGCKMCS